MQTDSARSHDPIIDHLFSSHAVKGVVWCFFASVLVIGAVVVVLNGTSINTSFAPGIDFRSVMVVHAIGPLVCSVPIMITFVLPFSRRLR